MNKLYIISSGAGGTEYLSSEAKSALLECEVVVSYKKYAKELESFLDGKEVYMSGMTQEIERCNQAIEFAKSGKVTCIISNGDANVFGMATLIVELIDTQNLWDEIELISLPGITSFLAAAAKVGAPVSQDFAIISLSDRLTDINMIDKRVKAALDTDFIIGIYNPKSKKRIKPYQNFLQALKDGEEKIAIIASNVGRVEKEKITITTTTDLINQDINHPEVSMSTMIIICNSNTRLTKNGLVLTPRGYLKKYKLDGDLLHA
ncbi:precorrin-3B C(17)-methyltransferase [Sulfurospirillum arcachonense]|uniref:precorrin-3B C(17)-methyltransferase n=1 Tax=Sulfurospirillum arcachonense TaxID=57666 RepID=UPI00046AC54C|nr:precorrin-3B C(17)-methyltransferase [Sulfurospirillum arcachonense]